MTVYTHRWLGVLVVIVGLLACTGCGDSGPNKGKDDLSKTAKGKEKDKDKDDDPGHSHERGKMMIADAGKYHALLTAHLSSKDGNELDIFFETSDPKNPESVPLPLESFTAQASTGEGEPKELKFEPTPKEERKDDPEGKCSHFVAKAPWMKKTDNLLVVAKVPMNGKEVTIRWKDFNPKKFAHHED